MVILQIHDDMPSWLGAALTRFEEQFAYPLGRDAAFHVSHGSGYLSFFRAMGRATLFVAVEGDEVLGTLAGIRRPMRDGKGDEVEATYLCDLKVGPGAQRGRVFLGLARELEGSWRTHGGGPGYGVVMNGTARSPAAYTGRCLVPGFSVVGELIIYRIEVPLEVVSIPGVYETTIEGLRDAFLGLTRGGMVPLGGVPEGRSLMVPAPLVLGAPARACGLVEDTRRGKRLLLSHGEEMRSAHLSHFAWAAAEDGALLVRAALEQARAAGLPALFVGVPASKAEALQALLADLSLTVAPATVFGHGVSLPGGGDWWIHTSEI